jgi:hypothetical protein
MSVGPESTWVLEPYIRAQSSFNEPVAIPGSAPDSPPFLAARIPSAWLPYVLGALSQLRMPATWVYANNTDLNTVMKWVDYLICEIGQAMPFVESGSLTITILAGNSDATSAVTFPIPYDMAPVVTQSSDSEVLIASSTSITTTGFTARITAATPVLVNTSAVFSWCAQEAS